MKTKALTILLIFGLLSFWNITDANAGTSNDCKIQNLKSSSFPVGFPRPDNSLLGIQNVSIFLIPYAYTDLPFSDQDYENAKNELDSVKKYIEFGSYNKVSVTTQIAAQNEIVQIPRKNSEISFSNQYFTEKPDFNSVDDAILQILNTYKGNQDLSKYTVVGMISPSSTSFGLGFSGRTEGYETNKGRIFRTFMKFGDVAAMSTLTMHELNHSLFNLPDLYNHAAAALGKPKYVATAGWGIMSDLGNYGRNYFSWEKFLNGWLSEDQVSCVNAKSKIKVTLTPASDSSNGLKMLGVKVSDTKILVVEYRVPGLGYDAMNVKNGALVYLVDSSLENGKDQIKVLLKPNLTTLKNKQIFKYGLTKITQVSSNTGGVTIQVN